MAVHEGLRLHQQGDFDSAEHIYRSILALEPAHPDALHLLGLIVAQRDLSEGIALIERAIQGRPRVSAYHNNLGNLLMKAGRRDCARRSYKLAIAADPRNADAHGNLGKLHHAAGDLAGARACFARALVLTPRSVEASISMGRLEQDCGEWPTAREHFRTATELAPGHAPAHLLLGKAQQALGEWDEAERSLRTALERDPGYADACFNLGNVQRSRGKLAESAESYRRAIALGPANAADAYNNLGVTLADLGQGEAAIAALLRAVELRPDYADAFFNLGKEAARQGDRTAAVSLIARAIALDPAQAAPHQELGNLHREAGHLVEAVACYRRAIAIAPAAAAEAYNNLGAALADLDLQGENDAAARAAFEQAVALRPEYDDAWFNLGKAAVARGEDAAAFDLLGRALQINPAHAKAHQELGALEESCGRLEEAAACYVRSLHVDPECSAVRSNLAALKALMGDREGLEQLRLLVEEQPLSAQAHWTRSMGLLLHGCYREGWAEYEWRMQVKDCPSSQRSFIQPRWSGEPLAGRTILLYAEQGLGDTLQFARYLPLVAERGGRVAMEVQQELKRLLARWPGAAECVAQGDSLPEFSTYASLMSLPYLLGATEIPVPAAPTPLFPSPVRTAGARELGVLQVGLAWAGNPKHKRDRLRSIPLKALLPLTRIGGVAFTSLQLGPAARERVDDGAAFQFVDDCTQARDLADTASIVSSLDLILTVDTVIAHLAGTLGKPVWILLDRTQDWRWGLHSSSTPWYPSARLFRQVDRQGWGPVIAGVVDELCLRVSTQA